MNTKKRRSPTLRPWLLPLAAALLTASPSAASAQPAAPAPSATLQIPFTRYQLPSGLTVILHEDRRQPLVVVNVSYQVGSRDEDAGRTGFAHLFEHLMFMGTQRVPEKRFDQWMEQEGGWNNAWTSSDRTDYYDVGPSHILPLLLWMEADRMEVLGSQIDAAKLATQRDVVRNERRQQVENRPYGKVELRLPELLYPLGHPYHHPVIGSHEDLEAATVTDVQRFFARWYTPANASLVVAGDFDPTATRAAIEKYFGPMRGGAAPTRGPAPALAPLTAVVRETLTDSVTRPKLIMAWRSPALYAPGDAELDLAASVLSSGKASRLYRALVFDRQLAETVSAYQSSHGLGSAFHIEAVARPGVTLSELEAAIDEQLARLRDTPPDTAEVQRAKNRYESAFVERLQSLEARASMLNGYQADVGDPGFAARDLERYLGATPRSVHDAVRGHLGADARVILQVVPHPDGAEPGDDEGGGQ